MDNDAARHQLIDALALVEEQLADLAVVENVRATLSATATRADRTVAVTVNADGVVTDTVVCETYFDHHELAGLGRYITAAAQEAAREVTAKVSDLLAPLARRRERLPSLSDIVDGAPDLRDLLSPRVPVTRSGGEEMPDEFPTVRSE